MPPRILRIVKAEPHAETVTEIALPDDPRDPTPLAGIDVTPSLTVLAHTNTVDSGHAGFHEVTVDLTGVTAITLEHGKDAA